MNDYYSLLARYGVSTPELAYAGIAAPTDASDPEYNAMLGKYQVDRAEYDRWLAEYKRRKASWDMYGPDYQGELLGKPTYTYGYEYTDPAAAANPEAPAAPTMPEAPAAPVVGEGGNYSGGNNDPLGGREPGMGLGYNPGNIGWSMDQATQYARENPVGTSLGMLAMPAATLARLGYAGITRDTPSIDQAAIDNENTRRENAARDRAEASGNMSFSDLSPTDQASISNAADPIGALADALGMGGPSDGGGYDGSGHDQSGDGASGGSRDGDSSHGWAKGGLVGLHNKYSGGGLAGGQNLSPELEAFIRADAQANGIENPTTNFQGGRAFGFQPTALQEPSQAATLLELTSKYAHSQPREHATDYAAEHQEARQAVTRETAAFNDMLKQAMEQKTEGPSRAEMYFKLAAALAAPTKTGAFGESMGNAASVMAEHEKDARAANASTAARKLELEMAGQKARMDAARTDLSDLRQLTAKEMDTAKAQAIELMKVQLQAGKPQSEAGKIAMDQGLQPGTPAYTKFVNDYVTDKIESGKLFKEVMLSIAQQGTNIRQSAENRKVTEMSMLSPAEGKMIATEQTALDAKAALARNLELAYQLNKKAMSGSGIARATGAMLGAVGYPSERLKAEEELTQNLTQASLDYASRLKPMSDADARLAQKLTGLQGTSPASRAAQIEALFRQTQAEIDQHKVRIEDVRSRKNRTKSTLPATLEGAE